MPRVRGPGLPPAGRPAAPLAVRLSCSNGWPISAPGAGSVEDASELAAAVGGGASPPPGVDAQPHLANVEGPGGVGRPGEGRTCVCERPGRPVQAGPQGP